MILIIEGSDKQVTALHKELKLRAKRNGLDMLIEGDMPPSKGKKKTPKKVLKPKK